jgi:two-component sensor histidine kinase
MILKRPNHTYTTYEDKLKFGLAWGLANITVLITLFLSLGFYFFDRTMLVSALLGILISSIFLLTLKYSPNYKLVAFAYALVTTLFFCLLMLFASKALHLAEYIWIFVVVIYSYAMCGKKKGNFVLILNIISLSLHIWFSFNDNIHIIDGAITNFHLISTIITIALGFLSFGYVVNKQAKIKADIEQNLNKLNLDLFNTNKIVAAQNKEKEVMLKEIHHRVKNNLQIIVSLLRVQYNRNKNPELQSILETNVTRINSIAMIHEKMYQSKNLAIINYKEYLNSLINEIIESFGLSNKIEYTVTSNLDNIGNRTVVPLALIFNELITNSLKHAFTNVEAPQINITLKTTTNNHFILTYTDNGTWKDVGKDYDSLGLELIEIFTEQLEGNMTRTSVDHETKYQFNLEIID